MGEEETSRHVRTLTTNMNQATSVRASQRLTVHRHVAPSRVGLPQRRSTSRRLTTTGAGKVSPAPPIGPALGSKGVNIMAFCKEYNAKTQDKAGTVIPVEITVYEDKSFTFVLKTPPASVLIKKAAGIKTGSGNPSKEKVGTITMAQLKEIAETKLPDLNCRGDLEAAMAIVGGTASNMGITVEE